MLFAGDRILSEQKAKNEEFKLRLFSLDPQTILSRGYSVVTKEDKTVSSVSQIKSGDNIKIILKDGETSATIE